MEKKSINRSPDSFTALDNKEKISIKIRPVRIEKSSKKRKRKQTNMASDKQARRKNRFKNQ